MKSKVLTRQKIERAAALAQEGKLDDAEKLCRQACRSAPADADAWALLSAIQGHREDFKGAFASAERAVRLQPNRLDALLNAGKAGLRIGQGERAIAHYEAAVSAFPNDLVARKSLGFALYTAGRFSDSVQHLEQAIRMDPMHAPAYFTLGQAFNAMGKASRAIAHFQTVLKLSPDFPDARLGLATALVLSGRDEDADEQFRIMLEKDPESRQASVGRIALLERRGKDEEALAAARALAATGYYSVAMADTFARLALRNGGEEEALDYVEQTIARLSQGAVNPRDLSVPHMQAGKLLEKLGRYDAAFSHYKRSNELYGKDQDPRRDVDTIRRLVDIFSAELFDAIDERGSQSERPIFIVGMPRSGTTLVEQILSMHPRVSAGGELEVLGELSEHLMLGVLQNPALDAARSVLNKSAMEAVAQGYLRHLDAIDPAPDQRVTDKLPHNFVRLGFIALLFPGARIIHCRRDPLDTCLSIYANSFAGTHPYATDLVALGEHYRVYRELMAHWRQVLPLPILDIDYEQLVDDQETGTREMLAFCGLDWDPACLGFHASKRVAKTLSYAQVRKPIYKSSVGRAERFGHNLEPLRRALEG